jgi:hypothetical protein
MLARLVAVGTGAIDVSLILPAIAKCDVTVLTSARELPRTTSTDSESMKERCGI